MYSAMAGGQQAGEQSCYVYLRVTKWAIPFFIHTGVWKANSLGVRQKRFPRESKTKTAFPRGSGQVFQKGYDG